MFCTGRGSLAQLDYDIMGPMIAGRALSLFWLWATKDNDHILGYFNSLYET